MSAEKAKKNETVETDIQQALTEENESLIKELEEAKAALEKAEKEVADNKEQYLRLFAEFDNFKKRSVKEKQQAYSDAKGDALTAFLPVVDNIERALQSNSEGEDLKKGVELIMKQVLDVMASNGIEEIEALGKTFDPNFHNAVMHIEDESFGEQEICEVFQKGYKIGDKVVRYSVVKVAN